MIRVMLYCINDEAQRQAFEALLNRAHIERKVRIIDSEKYSNKDGAIRVLVIYRELDPEEIANAPAVKLSEEELPDFDDLAAPAPNAIE